MLTGLSYWLSRRLPIDDTKKLELLSIHCPTQRLIKGLEILKVGEGRGEGEEGRGRKGGEWNGSQDRIKEGGGGQGEGGERKGRGRKERGDITTCDIACPSGFHSLALCAL